MELELATLVFLEIFIVVFSFSISSFIFFPAKAFINMDGMFTVEASPLFEFIIIKSSVQPESPVFLLYTTTALAPAV